MGCILKTERLGIRELTPKDAPELAKVLCDPASMAYYPRPLTMDEVAQWIARNIRRYQVYGYGLWALELLTDNSFVGECGITIQRIDNELLPELGFHVLPMYRRQGFATEASISILQYAASQFNLRAVYSYCEKDNTPSQKNMFKVGLSYCKEYTEELITRIVFSKTLVPGD